MNAPNGNGLLGGRNLGALLNKKGGADAGRVEALEHELEQARAEAAKAIQARRQPLMIDIERIHEDPDQPRGPDNPGFTPESIAELAASFGPNGPKTPLSLRDHPEIPGDYIINHGARRYRAGKVKGLPKLPAFIDNEHDDDDQIIENIQREGQSPREIANAIGRRLAAGLKQKDIAARWGKSGAWVSQYNALLDLPEPVAEVFNNGRVSDVTVINELVRAYKENPAEAAKWLKNPSQEITRGEVELFREYLSMKKRDQHTVDAFRGQTDREATAPGAEGALPAGAGLDAGTDSTDAEQGAGTSAAGDGQESGATSQQSAGQQSADPMKLKKAILQVEHDGRPARLMLTKRPPAEGYAWLKYEDDGREFEASLADVRLVALLEG